MSNVFEICKNLPEDGGVILENMIIADSKINSPIYKKILCTVSGGSDSDIVVDICKKLDRDGKIDYVWFDTGLEYEKTKEHIRQQEKKYGIKIEKYKAKKPIPVSCRTYGQPFISKQVSEFIERLQRNGFGWEDREFDYLYKKYPKCKAALRWWCNEFGEKSRFNIAYHKWLKEFMIEYPPERIGLAISPKCCQYSKKDVLHGILKERGYDLNISGIRKYEGGARATAYKSCFDAGDNQDNYRPIFFYTNTDKEIYKSTFGVENSECYTVYGLQRTGCAGCPFGRNCEEELQIIEKYEPKLYAAVQNIFGESYKYTKMYHEYRAEKEREKKNNEAGYEQLKLKF